MIHDYQSDMSPATSLFLILLSPKVLVHPYGILFLIKKEARMDEVQHS